MRRILAFLAAALGLAAQAQPIPITVTTVDADGTVGSTSSIRYGNAGPMIAYYDATHGDLKFATCIASCDRTNPTWVITTLDSAGDVGHQPALQLGAGNNPVVAYYDATNQALKLATCLAACATTSASWVVTTVDRGTNGTGFAPSLLVPSGNPVVAYRNNAGDVKLATCTAACATASPAWTITTIDNSGPGTTSLSAYFTGRLYVAWVDSARGMVKYATCGSGCASAAAWTISAVEGVGPAAESGLSLAINEGFPVLSYYDATNRDLKLATCTSGCAGGSPSWRIETVDSVGQAGQWSALIMNGGTPTVAYSGAVNTCMPGGSSCRSAEELRIAVCESNCANANWAIRTVDAAPRVGWAPSMTRTGDTTWISYHDIANGDLKMAVIELVSVATVPNHTSLWWDPQESGWGINFTHQGNIVFGTLFTYDAAGEPMWLVMSSGLEQSRNVFSGTLYRTTGPLGAGTTTAVGTMTVGFAGNTAMLAYDVNGAVVSKTLHKQVFGEGPASCYSSQADRSARTNYQDLWWNPAEPGWGINLAHQGNTIFATLFTYDAAGRGLWLVMSSGTRQSDGSFSGDLYRARGPAFNASPFTPIGSGNLTRVGSMQLRFTSGTQGTLTYSVDGASVSKPITRQVFAASVPFCSG